MSLRDSILKIYSSCLQSLQPEESVYNYLNLNNFNLNQYKNIFPVAFGKAAFSMMNGLINYINEKNYQEKISKNPIIVSNSNHPIKFQSDVYISSHPTPNNVSVEAAEAIMSYYKGANNEDLCLTLISGGGSSLVCLPHQGIKLSDKITVNNLLLESGANINEINTVRKHLSQIKGGRLANAAKPARITSLIISDVINDDMSSIASGPTALDKTTFSDAQNVIKKYKLENKIPSNIKNIISDGIDGKIDDSPKISPDVQNELISSNKIFRKLLHKALISNEYKVFHIERDIVGTARDEGANLALESKKLLEDNTSSKKIAMISGGETTVKIIGDGIGGRNQELALSFLSNVDDEFNKHDWSFLSVGTDGIDGPTDAAGAILDNQIHKESVKLDLNINDFINNNDSYNYLKKLNSLLITGPSGNNIADIQILLINKK